MRLDSEGDPSTIAELLARFENTLWYFPNELTLMEDGWEDAHDQAESAGSVRLYPAGLSTDEPVETGDGPFVVIVDGDLVTPDVVRITTDDYVPGLVIVTGDLHAGSLWFDCGARVMVEGSATVANMCVGEWGDRNALLDVQGELAVPLLAVDGCTPVLAAGGVRSVIAASRGWWKTLRPDILPEDDDSRYFRPELLNSWGGLDRTRAFAAAQEGEPVFLPGVEESFPQRLEARITD